MSSDGPDWDNYAVLGGEVAKRGWTALLPATRPARLISVVVLVLAVSVALSAASIGVLLVTAAIVVGAWFLVWPRHGGDSRLDGWLRRRRGAHRRRTGLADYTRPEQLAATAGRGGWVAPFGVGEVRPLDVTGSVFEQLRLFALVHTPAAGVPFVTVLMATGGVGAGLNSDAYLAGKGAGFGALLASCAEPTVWISELQQISRTLPEDLGPHELFMRTRLAAVRPDADAPGVVRQAWDWQLDSYDDLLEKLAADAEAHRNYLVARFDVTGEFETAAARQAPGEAGWAKLIRDDLLRLQDQAASAGLGSVQVLGEQRTVAALRAIQSPSFLPDHHAGLSWGDAFRSFTTDVDELVVDDRWHTRIAEVPRDAPSTALLHNRWLDELLVSMSPSVVRTVSVVLRPITAAQARAAAVADTTMDTARSHSSAEAGRIDDGTDTALLTASTARLADLQPGSGHTGLEWVMFIAVQAEGREDLLDACRQIEAAAGKCGITGLVWCDHEHDLAWPAVLPLGRGLN